MASYRLTSKAEEDLLDIWSYIAEHSPASATALLRTLHQRFTLLAEHTHLGQARPDISPDMRYFPVKRYLILYRQIPEGVEVVRVVHGSRDLDAIFESDDPS